jgi:hypothetical protein
MAKTLWYIEGNMKDVEKKTVQKKGEEMKTWKVNDGHLVMPIIN